MGFSQTCTNRTMTISHNNNSAESEPPSPLNNLGRPVDRNHSVKKFQFFHIFPIQPLFSAKCVFYKSSRLKFQTCLSDGFSQRLDASMIEEASPIKDHLLNTHGLQTFRYQFADFFGLIHLFQLTKGSSQFLTQRGSL